MLTESRRRQLEDIWPELRMAIILGLTRAAAANGRSIRHELDDLIGAAATWLVSQIDEGLSTDPSLVWRSVQNALQDRSSLWNGPAYNHTAGGFSQIAPVEATEGQTRTHRVAREFTATIRTASQRAQRRGALAGDERPDHLAAYCLD